jgi:hypothetical protein
MKTRLFKISTPAPAQSLKEELQSLLNIEEVHILNHDDLESCLLVGLTFEDVFLIANEVADVLIHELDYSINAEISIEFNIK